ncbi:hypothetical protein ACIOJE_07835 [Kitasatospora sp. NPDC087861]|uniref:hypothetical protein n=1 Tax=Kitasatospora sp. NPDC087861 TaxID=3364070 RepID=UPI00380077FF
MRIQRTRWQAGYTPLPNAVLRHPRLSLAARGLLGHLLSLPDGARETIESITKRVREGRRRVSDAMAELVAEGYVVRRREQDPETGQWVTHVIVSDVPMGPTDQAPTVGEPTRRYVGRSSKEEKTGEKNPLPVAAADVPATSETGEEETPQDELTGRSAALLGRLGAVEPRLTLSAADAATLAPLAAEWLSRGVSEAELRAALTTGLPSPIYSPAKILAARLKRVPAPRAVTKSEPAGECAECDRPLARGQVTGICGQCARVAAPADTTPRTLLGEGSRLVAAIRERRAGGHFAPHARSRFATF